MDRVPVLALLIVITWCVQTTTASEDKTILSSIITPKTDTLKRQGRSYYDYYDYRFGRPYDRYYDRLEYARPAYDRPRCGRCDDRDDRDDSDERRDDRRDDRRDHKPTHGDRYDKKHHDNDEDKYDRKKNGTDDDSDDKKRHDDKDRPSRRGGTRDRERDRHRYDDRDRYRPDYYDRFLRDRDYYDRPYYDELLRRPYDRYPDRYDGFGYEGYRRPGYEDDAYGGYGPSVGRGPHDSFRPWDETYRGQAGWDAGGRGYYFASGRPDAAPASGWGRPEYARPQSQSGWQNAGYAGGYPQNYQGSGGYSPTYRQDLSSSYGQASGWHSVGERRYRDESGVKNIDNREAYENRNQNGYSQPSQPNYGQPNNQAGLTYGQPNNQAGHPTYGQTYGHSSTTPSTSYLFQREDEIVTIASETTTKTPS